MSSCLSKKSICMKRLSHNTKTTYKAFAKTNKRKENGESEIVGNQNVWPHLIEMEVSRKVLSIATKLRTRATSKMSLLNVDRVFDTAGLSVNVGRNEQHLCAQTDATNIFQTPSNVMKQKQVDSAEQLLEGGLFMHTVDENQRDASLSPSDQSSKGNNLHTSASTNSERSEEAGNRHVPGDATASATSVFRPVESLTSTLSEFYNTASLIRSITDYIPGFTSKQESSPAKSDDKKKKAVTSQKSVMIPRRLVEQKTSGLVRTLRAAGSDTSRLIRLEELCRYLRVHPQAAGRAVMVSIIIMI